MKIKKLLTRMLLVTAGLCVGGSAWADEWSVDFGAIISSEGLSDKAGITISSESTFTVDGTTMGTVTLGSTTVNSNFVMQNKSWIARTSGYIQNNDNSDKSFGIRNCLAGQIIILRHGNAGIISASNATLISGENGVNIYKVNADGDVKITHARYLYIYNVKVLNALSVTDANLPFTSSFDTSSSPLAGAEYNVSGTNVSNLVRVKNTGAVGLFDTSVSPTGKYTLSEGEKITISFTAYNGYYTSGAAGVKIMNSAGVTLAGYTYSMSDSKVTVIIGGETVSVDEFTGRSYYSGTTGANGLTNRDYVTTSGMNPVVTMTFQYDGTVSFSMIGGQANYTYTTPTPLDVTMDLAAFVTYSTVDNADRAFCMGDLRIVPYFDYKVNAVDGSNNILKELSSGTDTKGANISYSYSRYMNINGTLYEAASNSSSYSKNFDLSSANQIEKVTYTPTSTTNVVFYSEAEDLVSSSFQVTNGRMASEGSGTLGASSGGNNLTTTPITVTTLPAGSYKVTVRVGGKNNRTYKVLSNGEEKLSFNNNGYMEVQSVDIVLEEDAVITLDGGWVTTTATNASGFDYVYITGTPTNEIIGALDYTTGANAESSTDYIMKQGDTKVFTFQNHGTTGWNNYRINVKEGSTWKSNTRADFYDETGNYHLDFDLNDGAEDWQLMSTDGGSTKTYVNWDNFASDMADATVEATLVYSVDGKLTIDAVATGSTPGYKYYVHNEISGLSSDLTINLSVCQSWLEILSVEQTAVGATLDNAGFATYASAYPLDVTTANMTGATAYKAAVNGTTVRFTELNQTIPANTGILLKGEANATVTIPVAESGTAVTENAFLVNEDGTTFTGDDNYYYFAMLKNEAKLTFATFNPSTLAFPTNKAYLKVAKSNFTSGARLLAVFGDDETTGISQMESGKLKIENAVYNLNGQRVAQPTKGLYIVGGKKVMMK